MVRYVFITIFSHFTTGLFNCLLFSSTDFHISQNDILFREFVSLSVVGHLVMTSVAQNGGRTKTNTLAVFGMPKYLAIVVIRSLVVDTTLHTTQTVRTTCMIITH